MNENNIDVIPRVVIDVSKYRIRIHRSTIKSLGNPEYVQLLVNPTEKTMAILPTDRNDKKAHRIKYNNHSFEIYSMLFVESICKLTNKFESGNRYTICGRFIPEKKLALFNLDKAEKVVYDIRYGG